MRRLFVLCLALLTTPAFAQSNWVGDWRGTLEISSVQPGAPDLTIILHVAEEGDAYAVTFDSPDQGAFGIPFDEVEVNGDTLVGHKPAMQATFTGVLAEDGSSIDGMWQQGGGSLPFVLTPYTAPAAQTAAESPKRSAKERGNYSGDWLGAMPMPGGGEVRLTFTLTRTEGDTYAAILNAPGQAENLDLGEITVQGRYLVIPIMGQATFSGTVSDDETTMEGEMAMGGEKQALTLTRR